MTPGARRSAVAWAITEKGCSQRRACALVGLAPKTDRYTSLRADDADDADDADVRVRVRVLASERRRFGYRRLHILLLREGVLLTISGCSDFTAVGPQRGPTGWVCASEAGGNRHWGRGRP